MRSLAVSLFTVLLLFAPVSAAERHETSAGPVLVEKVVDGLDQPWAVAFLDQGRMLITERDGALKLIDPDGRVRRISGVPKVRASRQGGLLDVVAARDYATSKEVFLSYAQPAPGGARTALAVARVDEAGASLTDLRVLFHMNATSGAGVHFGSRIVEAADGTLFLTIGDRGDADQAQNMAVHNGKVIRINRDGSIPADNPFADGPAPEIWSIGHRNPQGATLDLSGTLWTSAHGARGGDEVNRPEAGANYGWPVISYGRHYFGGKIGEGVARPGMEQPLHYWDPSIAPSGMMIYSGKLFPDWRGDIFVGSLKFDMISRLEVGAGVTEAERLFQDAYIRIRDVREGPDGAIWFLAIGDDGLFRVTPVK